MHAARDTSENAAKQISQLLQIFRIAPVTGAILSAALKCNSPDYEDAVLAEAVRWPGVDGIVTPKREIQIHRRSRRERR